MIGPLQAESALKIGRTSARGARACQVARTGRPKRRSPAPLRGERDRGRPFPAVNDLTPAGSRSSVGHAERVRGSAGGRAFARTVTGITKTADGRALDRAKPMCTFGS